MNDEDLEMLIIEIEEYIEKAFEHSIEYYRKLRRQVRAEENYRRKLWLEATLVADFYHRMLILLGERTDILVLVGPQLVAKSRKWKVPDIVIYHRWNAIAVIEFKIYPNNKRARHDRRKLKWYRDGGFQRGYFIHIDHGLKTFERGAKFEKDYYRELAANMTRMKKIYR